MSQIKHQIIGLVLIGTMYGSLAQTTGKNIDKRFASCITKAAENPDYKSTDGGTSAQKMLEKDCPDPYIAWVNLCTSLGDEKKSCVLKAAIAAQSTLKLAGR